MSVTVAQRHRGEERGGRGCIVGRDKDGSVLFESSLAPLEVHVGCSADGERRRLQWYEAKAKLAKLCGNCGAAGARRVEMSVA